MASLAAAYRRMIDRKPSALSSWAVFSLFWPLAILYRLVVGLRTVLYRCGLLPSYRAAVPVISAAC
jgi:tetraacyldisaccharide-1-P 4'-kinase